MGEGFQKQGSLFCQAVDLGGLDVFVVIAAQPVGPQCVYGDEQNIQRIFFGAGSCGEWDSKNLCQKKKK
jgi:hypothetical protein